MEEQKAEEKARQAENEAARPDPLDDVSHIIKGLNNAPFTGWGLNRISAIFQMIF